MEEQEGGGGSAEPRLCSATCCYIYTPHYKTQTGMKSDAYMTLICTKSTNVMFTLMF